jgi:cytochrome c551/c552
VFDQNCRKCHSAPTKFGAPIPLITHDHLTATAAGDASKKIYDLVKSRVNSEAAPMPPAPNARLSDADKKILDDWIAAGAPKSNEACGGNNGDAGVVTALDCKPDLSIKPASAWTMPKDQGNEYVCYGVDVDTADDKHIVALAPRIDNPNIVHHVLIFAADTSYPTTPQKCSSGGSLAWRLMFGWAPGGKNMVMPQEAGYAVKKGRTNHYVVQVHYNNAQGLEGEKDTSGFELCTAAPRQYEADVLVFGTTKIDLPPNSQVDKTCSVTIPNSLAGKKIFAAMPHMHELGTAIDTKLYPGGTGTPVDLGSAPKWDFQTQYWLPLTAELKANDVVKTRCAWKNTTGQKVKFGENTEDEMCYSFTMYYPKIDSALWSWQIPAYTSQCQ